ncbi:RNA polymerase factor sigma-54 [Flammeovirgaceae bacterium SG7u.111]|nr:RNA polymerase factor sigma-54 [Flammeovirgaceae bacterium SG7u.132]WPO34499.1 RNA polymerase factor sigma-54 [Flammeovirgaceae bacterium SG7u.111]
MQKLNLTQSLSQKLSPQQIQFIKLLQIPTMELSSRIEEELEINPALEEGKDEGPEDEAIGSDSEEDYADDYDELADVDPVQEVNIEEYISGDDISGYKMQGDGGMEEEDREMPIATMSTLTESLLDQLGYLRLDERQLTIGEQLIGSIDGDGYVRRDIEAIVNDLAFTRNIDTTEQEIEAILKQIQHFDPPGIAARDLQECLYLQLLRKDQESLTVKHAIKIVMLCFEEFKKKHYSKIEKKIGLTESQLKDAISIIIKLNPKPGESISSFSKTQYLTPDFILKEVAGRLEVSLNSKNAPELRVSRSYADMLDSYDKSKNKKKDKKLRQTVTFVKQKLDAAKWFIDAIKQRQETLLKTMRAIIMYQEEFFFTGDEGKLRPMILKDIAQEIGMDISTVSRVANSKSVQTDFGLFPLKFFFSESITTDTGEDVSSKEVKHVLKNIIEAEDKRKPLSDDKLEKMLKDKSYQIARRTVAKYREQLGIPVARLRKEL